MSFAITDAQVRDHMRDVRQQNARCRGRSPQSGQFHGTPDPRHPSDRRPQLRSRIAFRLIEAGLYLLADHPQPQG